MKIAIDLNDVVRDYSANFLKYYLEGYNRTFDLTDFEFWSHDLMAVFPFSSQASYYNFIYNDYAFELYGKCETCSRKLTERLNDWIEKTIKEVDVPFDIDVMFVSTKEYGLSIGNTYYFISKLGVKVREVYFPIDQSTIWDKCDVLITANPELLAIKPEDKISIKIETDYNKNSDSDFSFNSLDEFITDQDNIKKLNWSGNDE